MYVEGKRSIRLQHSVARGATNRTRFRFQGNLCAAAGTKSCHSVKPPDFYVLLMNAEIQRFEAARLTMVLFLRTVLVGSDAQLALVSCREEH